METKTLSGGTHLAWRSTEDPGHTEIIAVNTQGKNLIEYRAHGRFTADYPSPGYTMVRGDLLHLPTLTTEEHNFLKSLAKSFDEIPEQVRAPKRPFDESRYTTDRTKPGGDFNMTVKEKPELLIHLLEEARYENLHSANKSDFWKRPDYDGGNEFTARIFWNEDTETAVPVFFNYSPNDPHFKAMQGYDPFGVYAHLKHDRDLKKAASSLKAQGFGQPKSQSAGAGKVYTVSELRAKVAEKQQQPWLVESFLASGEVGVIVGDSGKGKTPLTLQLALCVVAGIPFLGFPTRQGKVLIINGENGDSALIRIIATLQSYLGIDDKTLEKNLLISSVDSFKGEAEIIAEIQKQEPTLTVIDRFGSCFPTFEKDNDKANELWRTLKRVLAPFGGSLIGLHHLTKPDSAVSYDLDKQEPVIWLKQARGAGAIINSAQLRLGFDETSDDKLLLRGFRQTEGVTPKYYLRRVLDEDGISPIGYERLTANNSQLDATDQKLFDKLPPEFTTGQLKLAMQSKSDDMVAKKLKQWQADGFIRSAKRGTWGKTSEQKAKAA